VDRIFVGLFLELHCREQLTSDGGQRGDKRPHNSSPKFSFCTIIIRLCHCMIAIDRAMAAKTKTEHYYSAHNVATRVNFDTWTSVHDSNHYDVDTIFVGLSRELHWRWQLDRALERWRQRGAKGLITPQPRLVSAQLLYVCVTAR